VSIIVPVYKEDDDRRHVNGVRLCLCSAVTNKPVVHSPGCIWAWRTTVDNVDWERLWIHPPERLSGSYTSRAI